LPTKGVTGVNTADMFWIFEVELTRKEIVEAVPIAKLIKLDIYSTATSLATQEQSLFLTAADYTNAAIITNEADRVAYVKINQSHLSNLGAEAAGTAALLKKQLGVVAVALLRQKVGVTNKKFMLGGAAATVSTVIATAVSPYEKVICRFYRFADYLTHPLSQTDLLSVVTNLRTFGANYVTQMTAAGYDYNADGNSYYTSIAQQYWATLTASKPVFNPTAYATDSVFPSTFMDDLIFDTSSAIPWRAYTTAQMYQKLDNAIGFKKCFDTYFSRTITYKDAANSIQTMTGPDPYEL